MKLLAMHKCMATKVHGRKIAKQEPITALLVIFHIGHNYG